jgi:hypothetical protein
MGKNDLYNNQDTATEKFITADIINAINNDIDNNRRNTNTNDTLRNTIQPKEISTEDDEDNYTVNLNIYRYKFNEEFTNELSVFSKIHQYDDRKVFKESWIKWTEENEDIVKLPSDVPIRTKKWDNLNAPSKNKVRRLTVAYVKKYLATIWAKTSGKIKLPQRDETLEIDYKFFSDDYDKEKDAIFKELQEQLADFTYQKIMEKKASIGENLNKVLQYTPPQTGIIWK